MNTNKSRPFGSSAAATRILVGAGIALALIVLFLLNAPTNPQWSPNWKIRPILVVTLAGAAGGFIYHYMRIKGSRNRLIANILSLIIYIIGLWLGTVLGLNGTLWN